MKVNLAAKTMELISYAYGMVWKHEPLWFTFWSYHILNPLFENAILELRGAHANLSCAPDRT